MIYIEQLRGCISRLSQKNVEAQLPQVSTKHHSSFTAPTTVRKRRERETGKRENGEKKGAESGELGT